MAYSPKNMQFGDRIKTPSSFFPSEYVEMRFFGPYEATVLPALLFRLLELTLEQRYLPDNPAYRSLVFLCSSNEVANQALEILAKQPLNKTEIGENLDKIAQTYGPLLGLNPNNPGSFQALCLSAGFSLYSTYFGRIDGPKSGVEVAMGLRNGLLFLLYPNYTFASFFDCSCGRYHLKYNYYRLLQERFGPQAVAQDEFSQANLCCPCSQNVGELVYFSCFGEQFPGSSTTDSGFHCASCRKLSDAMMQCGDHQCCWQCYGKNYFTGNYLWMPCCHRAIEEEAVWQLREWLRAQFPHLEPIMTDLKHDFLIVGKYARLIKPNAWISANGQTSSQSLPSLVATGEGYQSSTASALPNPPKTEPINIDSDTDVVEAEEGGIETEFLKQNGPAPGSRMSKRPKTPPIVQTYEEEKREVREAEKKAHSFHTKVSKDRTFTPLAGDKADVPTGEEATTTEKRSICTTCGRRYTHEDKVYQCPKACQCQQCIIQALVGEGDKTDCDICGQSYPIDAKNLSIRGFRQCHVCGIVIEINEIEFAAPCKLCYDCVTVTETSFLVLFSSSKGTCRLCDPTATFDIKEDFYKAQRASKRTSACCGRKTAREEQLNCGHWVCGTHKKALKYCRTCQKAAILLTVDS